jgi:hypothetical protein
MLVAGRHAHRTSTIHLIADVLDGSIARFLDSDMLVRRVVDAAGDKIASSRLLSQALVPSLCLSTPRCLCATALCRSRACGLLSQNKRYYIRGDTKGQASRTLVYT